ncbi:MAG TPA: group II truncated hemoglobin [Candidatus Saccharimonadia bacterium]|nr:group II truncated hemoglobin [Candidatus Saccharimonadia bacterium]
MADRHIPTLYEWAGGSEAFERLVTTFYDLTLQDELLRPFFEHMSAKHKHYVALWLIEVFGGPKVYSEVYGALKGHPHMIRRHLELTIPEAARVRWIQLMQRAADIEKLPNDAEFRSAFVAYFEWGTRMNQVFANGAPVPDESPVPSWGWGERTPYIPPE